MFPRPASAGFPVTPAVDRIGDLLYPWETRSLVDGAVVHRVRHRGLLDEIEHTVTGSTTAGQTFHTAYGSKPAGRIDALAWLERLDAQSRELAREYTIPLKPLRPRLSSLAGCLGLKRHRVVTGWWVSARVLTQHDQPPLAPNVPCPNEACDRWGTLRVRFEPNVALCVHCGDTWSDASFEQFAVWVRWAAEHLPGPHHAGCSLCLVERNDRFLRSAARAAEVG